VRVGWGLAVVFCMTAAGSAHAGEVTLWHAWRGEERAALETLATRWTLAHPDAPLRATFVPYDALAGKIEAAVPRGNGPDLVVYAHEKAGDWGARRLVLPVAPTPGALPVAAAALADGDRAWGWPLAAKALALYRDRSRVPDPPADTEALWAAARRWTRPPSAGEPARWGLAMESTSAYAVAPWLHGFGGGVTLDGGLRFARPENVAALGFVHALAREVMAPELSGAMLVRSFDEGRAAMAVSGPWMLGELRSPQSGGVDWAVSPLPVVRATGRPAAPWATVDAVFLTREGPEARAVGAWLAGPEAAAVRARDGRQVVAQRGVTYDDPALASFAAALDHAVPMPTDARFALHWEPLARALRRLSRGDAGPEAVLAQADTDVAVLTRPPPAPVAPGPWIAAVAGLATVGAGWAARAAWRARGAIARAAHAYAWLAPALAGVGLLVVLPFCVGAAVAFFETDGASWTFVGATHFLDILLARDWGLTSPLSAWRTLLVTVAWTVANLVLHVTLGVALALMLREPWVRLRGAFRALLVLPWAIPSYLTAMVWKGLFHREMGAVNALLALFGVPAVGWFDRFATAFAANLATNAWLGFPFMMVTTLGALQAMPRELEEAAVLDGATRAQRLRHVILPQLAPALLPAIVLGSVWTFNAFNVIYLVSGGEPDGTTDILVSQAYRWAFSRGHRYGYAAAYGMLIFGVLALYGRGVGRLLGGGVAGGAPPARGGKA
jgi:arabinogalactan oligomer/maltooligosaccharide transport system permease protein